MSLLGNSLVVSSLKSSQLILFWSFIEFKSIDLAVSTVLVLPFKSRFLKSKADDLLAYCSVKIGSVR